MARPWNQVSLLLSTLHPAQGPHLLPSEEESQELRALLGAPSALWRHPPSRPRVHCWLDLEEVTPAWLWFLDHNHVALSLSFFSKERTCGEFQLWGPKLCSPSGLRRFNNDFPELSFHKRDKRFSVKGNKRDSIVEGYWEDYVERSVCEAFTNYAVLREGTGMLTLPSLPLFRRSPSQRVPVGVR